MIRGLSRLVAMVVASLLIVPVVCVGLLLSLFGTRPRRAVRGWAMCVWARWLCWAFRLRVRVTGSVPDGPVVFTPNHLGYIDIPVLGALRPGFFVSRADVRHWPLLGPLSRLGGTLYIERDRRRDTHRIAESVEALLREGRALFVFLEGRAGPGDHVQPFHSSLLRAAVATGTPCVPIALRYRLPDAPDADVGTVVAWHDASPFLRHAWRLACQRRIEVDVQVLPPRTGDDRKSLAAALGNDVRKALSASAVPTPGPTDGSE